MRKQILSVYTKRTEKNLSPLKCKKKLTEVSCFKIWGGRRGSNPRMPEPQSGVLTASPRPPSLKQVVFYTIETCL